MATDKTDLYATITNKIIAELEAGTRPWVKPWNATHMAGNLPLRCTGEHYQGINTLLLWCAAADRGYSAPIWMTYKQAQERGAHVRKGEKSEMVVYANAIVKKEVNAAGDETEERIPFLKRYAVFNVEQIEGLPAHFYALKTQTLSDAQRNAIADQFFAAVGAELAHGGNRAYYRISEDRIQVPSFSAFCDPAAYYATLAHEHIHWTRHESRLNRDFGRKRFGDEGYAVEELVAEIGAAFLCARLGLEPRIQQDHAPYVEHWLKVLKADKRAIFTAASHAQRAADYLLKLTGESFETDEERQPLAA